MGPKPPSVIVLSIIGLVLAPWGLCGGTLNLLRPVLPMMKAHNPILDAYYAEPVYVAIRAAASAITLLMSVWLLIACIGSLRLRNWSRNMMLIYAWASIIRTALSLFISFVIMPPIAKRAMANAAAHTLPTVLATAKATLLYTGYVSLAFALVSLAFPICILIFFNKLLVRDAFHGIFPTAYGFEVQGVGPPPAPLAPPLK